MRSQLTYIVSVSYPPIQEELTIQKTYNTLPEARMQSKLLTICSGPLSSSVSTHHHAIINFPVGNIFVHLTFSKNQVHLADKTQICLQDILEQDAADMMTHMCKRRVIAVEIVSGPPSVNPLRPSVRTDLILKIQTTEPY